MKVGSPCPLQNLPSLTTRFQLDFSFWSLFKMAATAPQVIKLDCSEVLSTSCQVRWRKLAGCTGYEIAYRQDGVDGAWNIVRPDVQATTHTIENLLPRTTYRIRIRPMFSNAEGEFSAPIKVMWSKFQEQLKGASCTKKWRISVYCFFFNSLAVILPELKETQINFCGRIFCSLLIALSD